MGHHESPHSALQGLSVSLVGGSVCGGLKEGERSIQVLVSSIAASVAAGYRVFKQFALYPLQRVKLSTDAASEGKQWGRGVWHIPSMKSS